LQVAASRPRASRARQGLALKRMNLNTLIACGVRRLCGLHRMLVCGVSSGLVLRCPPTPQGDGLPVTPTD
jgi:hypothetical protein